jgi:5-methylthioadenosine/S-adenosylhomocysteine deaminase
MDLGEDNISLTGLRPPRSVAHMSLSIIGGLVITMDRSRRVLRDGGIAIEGNTIRAVGRAEDIRRSYKSDVEINARGKAVLPGFVNAHTHLSSIFVRGVYGVLTDGLYSVLFPIKDFLREDEMYIFSLASAIEALEAGCTTVVETYNFASQFAMASYEVGLRALVGEQIVEADFRKVKDDIYEYSPEKGDETLARAVKLIKEWKGNERIGVVLAPLAPDMCTPQLLERVRSISEEYGVNVTTHLAQSLRELKQIKRLYRKTPIEYLRDLNLLNSNLSVAHCIYATDRDLTMLRDAGVSILHCPRPYALNGVTAPLLKWLDLEMRVGLGTDNVYHSMFETLRAALYASRFRATTLGEPNAAARPTYMELLELATIRSAEAIGLGNEVGSIEVGKRADLLILNLLTPHLTPTLDYPSSLALYGVDENIETVIIDGKIVKDKGKVLTVDRERALLQAQEYAESLWNRFWESNPELRELWRASVITSA